MFNPSWNDSEYNKSTTVYLILYSAARLIMTPDSTPKGELETITFGEKILTVKRKCSCGGDVEIKKEDDGTNVASCMVCGSTIKWGGPDKTKAG
jgi:hypothetical protein